MANKIYKDTPDERLQAALDRTGERATYVKVEIIDLRALLNEYNRMCTSDDPTNHQGATCPIHEDETLCTLYSERDPNASWSLPK